MPHLKCQPCRARFSAADALPGARCTSCGTILQPVESLEELVGFRWQSGRDDLRRIDVGWDDDGWSEIAQAVALPPPDPDGGYVG
jgi:hypothetical protein